MAKIDSKDKVKKLRLLKLKATDKDEAYYHRKAIGLLDEVLDAEGMRTGEVIATLFAISHLFLDVGQHVLEQTIHDDEEAG